MPVHSKLKPPAKGSGGLSVAQQLYNRFKDAGKPLQAGDIAIVDAAEYHNYQVCLLSLHYIFRSPLIDRRRLCFGGRSVQPGWCVRFPFPLNRNRTYLPPN